MSMVRTLVRGAMALSVVAVGCGPVAEETDVEFVEQTEQAVTTQRVNKGAIAWGSIQPAVVVNTSTTHSYHAWKYAVTRRQVVTFMLEFATPSGDGRGAWLQITDPLGFKLKEVKASSGPRAHFDFNFTFPGTYYVIVRQAAPAVGSYPYKLGAEAHVCAFLEYPSPAPEWDGWTVVRAENLMPGEVQDPWTYFPSDPAIAPGTKFTWRDAFLGACDLDPESDDNRITAALCGASDPPVCGGNTMAGILAANKCAFRDWTANDTPDPGAWAGAYSTDLTLCQTP